MLKTIYFDKNFSHIEPNDKLKAESILKAEYIAYYLIKSEDN